VGTKKYKKKKLSTENLPGEHKQTAGKEEETIINSKRKRPGENNFAGRSCEEKGMRVEKGKGYERM